MTGIWLAVVVPLTYAAFRVVDWTVDGEWPARPSRWTRLLTVPAIAAWMICIHATADPLTGLWVGLFLVLSAAVAMADARSMLIPDHLTLVGGALGVALAWVPGGPGVLTSAVGFFGMLAVMWGLGAAGRWIFGKEALGGGDVTLLAMIGAFVGPMLALVALFVGSALALPYGLAIARRDDRRIPFGIFLAVGGVFALFFGPELLTWYGGWVIGRAG